MLKIGEFSKISRVSIRMLRHYDDEGMVWQVLCEETDSMNMIPADPCLVAAEFPDDEFKEENVEVFAWKTVKGTYTDTEHVKFKTLPAVYSFNKYRYFFNVMIISVCLCQY